jgi:hypothetical protein
VSAAPVLVKNLLTELQAWDCIFLDPDPFYLGGVANLFGKKEDNWKRKLQFAGKRGQLGGVLLLQDGDVELQRGHPLCARDIGRDLSRRARDAGAGSLFSVASLFALQEFESWLIAGIESLAGKKLADRRIAVPAGITAPEGDLEKHPRDAKGWLNQRMPSGYQVNSDQERLTRAVDLNAIRQRNLRSFRRLESALRQMVDAIRSGKHIVSPSELPPRVESSTSHSTVTGSTSRLPRSRTTNVFGRARCSAPGLMTRVGPVRCSSAWCVWP